MLIGKSISASYENPTEVWTPWVPRQGDAMTSTAELIAFSGEDANLTFDVYHKNSEDTGNGAAATTTGANAFGTPIGSIPATTNFRTTGLKEIVRYRITLQYTGETSGAVVYAHFRLLNPSWEFTGAQSI